jgi:hypothetical protein
MAGLVVAAMGACGPFCGSGKVAVTNARVDSSFSCPHPADQFQYVIHATMVVDNPTGKTLTIKSISEENTTVAIHGNWTGQLGAKGSETITNFSPTSVKSGDKATIKFTIAFQCTNSNPSAGTYGDFAFKFTVVTDAGTFTLTGANNHRILMSI